MHVPPAVRRAVLFLLALILPLAGVVALGLHSIAQERELVERRADEDRRRDIRRLHDDLVAELERLELGILNGRPATGPAVIALAVQAGRLVLPWDAAPAGARGARPGRAAFDAAMAAGERAEYAEHRLDVAAAAYQKAADAATTVADAGYARLQLARAQAGSGLAMPAAGSYLRVLAIPSAVTDDQHVPLAYYAAERLLDLRADAAAVARRLAAEGGPATIASLAPAAAYKLRALLERAPPEHAPPSGEEAAAREKASALLAERIGLLESMLALARDFPALLAPRLMPGNDGVPDARWLTVVAQRPWFARVSLGPDRHPVLVAVDAGAAFAAARRDRSAGARLVGGTRAPGADDQPLGPRVPDAAVRFAAAPAVDDAGWRAARNFYAAALTLVLGVTAIGGFLLWRDVRREVRLAELRSQFVASVSHELKTPLTAIRMFAETLLLRGGTAPAASGQPGHVDREAYLQTIVDESERLSRLINNVLDFSRIERGEKTYQRRPASLVEIVHAAVRSVSYSASAKGIEIEVRAPDGPCVVPVDADAIQQAVLNVLTNAIKYSGDSTRIALSLACEDGDAVIRVRDWGVGIPASDHRRIFDRFHRVASPENRSIPGTGLGLALVAHTVAGHGGRVDVESEPGCGSTFTIRLPREMPS